MIKKSKIILIILLFSIFIVVGCGEESLENFQTCDSMHNQNDCGEVYYCMWDDGFCVRDESVEVTGSNNVEVTGSNNVKVLSDTDSLEVPSSATNSYVSSSNNGTNETEVICTDHDVGPNNYTIVSSATLNNGTVLEDVCNYDGSVVFEATCDFTENIKITPISCDVYDMVCRNGACINNDTESLTCSDSDDGANYNVKGNVSLSNGSISIDYCIGDKLMEYWCDGNMVKVNLVNCQEGYSCSEGACIVNETELTNLDCIDSDDLGSDLEKYYARGTTIGMNGEFRDTCSNNILKEYYCNGSQVNFEEYNCPYGCSPGSDGGSCAVLKSNNCMDSDNGSAIFEKGEGSANSIILNDFCSVDSGSFPISVFEARCMLDGTLRYIETTCGNECSSGSC
jgi:hypothetical protein